MDFKRKNGLGDGGQTIQVSTLPTASASELDKVYQYTGTTDANYTHGYFYECVSDGATPPTYSWQRRNVQPIGEGETTSFAEIGGNATDNASLASALNEKTYEDDKRALSKSVNLFDSSSNEIIDGKYLYSAGQLISSESFSVSNYISVEGSTNYHLCKSDDTQIGSDGIFTCFYDVSKTFISSVGASNKSITTPANARYLRFSFYTAHKSGIQLVKGSSFLGVNAYNPIRGYLNNDVIKECLESSTVLELIPSNSINEEKTVFFVRNNIFNYANAVSGYINPNNGNVLTNPSSVMIASDFIEVETGKTYIGYKMHVQSAAYYDSAKTYVSAATLLTTNLQYRCKFTVPSGVKYVRLSFYKTDVVENDYPAVCRLNEGDTLLDFTAYTDLKLKAKYLQEAIKDNAASVASDTLGNTEIVEINNFPQAIQRHCQMSLSADVESWGGGIIIGRGLTNYESKYIKIDSTNVTIYKYDTQEREVVAATAHGLAITDHVKIIVSLIDTDILLVIQTLTSSYQHTFSNALNYSMNGKPFVKSAGAELENVVLNSSCSDFTKKVWMFGDSYFGISGNTRQLYYLKEWGFLNCLTCAYPGAGGLPMKNNFVNALKYGKPDFVVWAIGMNNGYTDWLNSTAEIIGICQSKGISLVLCTVPKPLDPSYQGKDEISEYVRSSGLRYIDVAKAVGSDANGHWYGYGESYDYQSPDNVHPSQYGAIAIATQFLTDFPELMEY